MNFLLLPETICVRIHRNFYRFSLLLAAVTLAPNLFGSGSQIIEINKKEKTIIVTQVPPYWTLEERACVFRNMEKLSCGTVISLNQERAIIQLNELSEIRVGDGVFAEKNYCDPAPPGVYPGAPCFYRSHTVNVAGGLAANHVALRAFFHLQTLVSDHIAIGVMPAYTKMFFGTRAMEATGAYFTYSYYHRESFRGFFLQLGSGFYTFDQQEGFSTASQTPSFSAFFGWREEWGLGFNIGIGGGVQYTFRPGTLSSSSEFTTTSPLFLIDLGLSL